MNQRPEPARRIAVPGVSGYVDRIGVPAGQSVRFHVNSPAAYELSIVRLGRRAILDPNADEAADRADVEVVSTRRHASATPQTLSAGSYVYVSGEPIPGGPLTLATWLRLWRLPIIDAIQWAWFGILTDFDYPETCRFGLLVDHLGRIGMYAGDGRTFRHEWLHLSEPAMASQLGRWVHVAATLHEDGLRIYLNGTTAYRTEAPMNISPPGTRARLRIGANAEQGAADDFLDGDVAQPFVAATVLDPSVVKRVVEDRARTPLADLGIGPLHATWPLDEERGAHVRDISGNARHGQIVQGGTWQIGGPAHDASRGGPRYDPLSDPDRGHGLRLSSDDLVDAEWSATDEWQVPEDADSGLYAGRVRLEGQDPASATSVVFAVTRTRPLRPDSIALLLATNTWLAYGRRPTDVLRQAGLSASYYSNHISGRPFFHVSTLAPIPRADPYGFESRRAAFTRHSHLVRPERYAEAWLATEGYAYEVITDTTLHAEPDLLKRFRVLMIVGHSEYWTDAERDGVAAFLADGGQVVSLSGNTLCWRTTFNDDLTVLESRKALTSEDERWLSPDEWGERWHSDDGRPGSLFTMLGRPGYEVLGLDTKGMIDDGTPTAFDAFSVLEPDHFLFQEPMPVPISSRGTIGETNLNGPRASGYEFDATPQQDGLLDEPLAGQVLLARAVAQRNIEWHGGQQHGGGDIAYWERPAGGRVFNAGSIGLTGALAVDPGIQQLVRNVLFHFGLRPDPERVTAGQPAAASPR
jgi:Concanavalin A-like lectin/glucanases superfamily